MLNYRVQTCLDNQTYEALQRYMKTTGYETVSVALRKLIRDSLGVTPENYDVDYDVVDCKTVKL